MRNLLNRSVVLLLSSLSILHSFCADAQIVQRDILRKATQQELPGSLIPQGQFKPFPQTPGEWKQLLPDSVISSIISAGRAELKKNFRNIPATIALEYVRNGNRTDYEEISFANRRQLWNMVLAETMEGKGRFTDHILDGIWAICEETFWGISAHVRYQKAGAGLPDVEDPIVDLFEAETGGLLALTDYFIGAELDKTSKLIRRRIRYEINRRMLAPMTTAQYGWMGAGKPNAKLNNWAPWIASNYILANLLIEKDETKRVEALHIAIKIIDRYINGLGADAGCDEGPGYWSAAGGCVFDALNLLYDATGGKVNVYKDPFIRKMGAYIQKTHIAGKYFINVADAHPEITPDGLMIYRFGKNAGYEPMTNFGSLMYNSYGQTDGVGVFHSMRRVYNLLAIKDCAAYAYHENTSPDVWYSDVQLMAARSENGMFLATHAGHNGESHNHNDVGDFIVYADGFPVIIDVGPGTYTSKTFSKDRYTLWFNTSPYHNLPTVNGQEQKGGTAFTAREVDYRKTANSAQLTMNIADAYPAESGIKSWRRKVEMNKRSGAISINDTYAMNAKPASIVQSFMSVCDIDISIPGKIIFSLPNQGTVHLDYNKKLWDANKETVSLTAPEDQTLKTSWKGRPVWRVLLTAKSPAASGSVTYSIHK
ncbi:heparinase II/III family protein [Chitinophaga sp. MM2321]|uniref:heparinase II/III domain-containing protein n=1 Tax=Chitinophaga sp. MM2321 TaxID=3137178 RepID=UPI0032D59013